MTFKNHLLGPPRSLSVRNPGSPRARGDVSYGCEVFDCALRLILRGRNMGAIN